jgi:hypothetical protein
VRQSLAVQALAIYKDVMEASDAIFSGEFDGAPETATESDYNNDQEEQDVDETDESCYGMYYFSFSLLILLQLTQFSRRYQHSV